MSSSYVETPVLTLCKTDNMTLSSSVQGIRICHLWMTHRIVVNETSVTLKTFS